MINPFKIWSGLLYILQSEQYDVRRYWKWVKTHANPLQWIDVQKRKFVVWTPKVKLIAGLSMFVQASIIGTIYVLTQALFWALLTTLVVVLFLTPVILIFTLWILVWPFDWTAKKIMTLRARRHLKKFPNLKIIGITGSYGKTTMKEVVYALLEPNFMVLKTPENINTLLGVGKLLMKELRPEHEIFIVEMGAFQKGDIRDLCKLCPPDISILTGINEAHLDRFGSIENTIVGKFEIVTNMKSGGEAFLNGKNSLIRENAARFSTGKKFRFYGISGEGEYEAKNISFDENNGWKFSIFHNGEQLFNTQIHILGSYIIDTILCGVMVARKLGVPEKAIETAIPNIPPIEHRLSSIHTPNDIVVIDDAYNGNPDGAREAMDTLKRFTNRRKIYLTPGLVELGKAEEKIHVELGKYLAACADVVLLIANNATPSIQKGLLDARFPKENIVFFETTQKAHAELANIVKSGDVILFQNDWPDQYF